MVLHNRVNSQELRKKLMEESFKRITISFYRYVKIINPDEFRNILYMEWSNMQCYGRIYIAKEGINAQMSIPEHNLEDFLEKLNRDEYLKDISVKYAIEDNGKSFYRLTIKIRSQIVADGLSENDYDSSDVGRHLNALEFHNLIDAPDSVVVDMRNHYESEVGRFKNAICPGSSTFREELLEVLNLLKEKKDKKILLYCTGGIRCEKASAYLKHHGFRDVNQLHGGILEYNRQIKIQNLESKFKGKNFVFDERMGERVTSDIISHCHQCGKACDNHINCMNEECHILFIQCDECKVKYDSCCSESCKSISELPPEERKQFRYLFRDNEGKKLFSKRMNIASVAPKVA